MSQLITIKLKDQKITQCEIITYPDGQRNIKLDMSYYNPKYYYEIECRINTFADLELLGCLIAAMKKNDLDLRSINFCYIFGMRSDRAFEIGMPNYFRDIIAPIINSYDIPIITFEMPHSYRCVRTIVNGSSNDYVLNVFDNSISGITIGGDETYSGYVDYNFVKKRSSDGSIRMHLPELAINKIKDTHLYERTYLIVEDDLCDGGATFIEAAKILNEHFPYNKLILKVYHGFFSKGFEELLKYYDYIFTTNSVREIESTDRIIVREVI